MNLDKQYDLPLEYHMFLYRRDAWSRVVDLKHDNGTPYDLAGAGLLAQIRYSVADVLPLAELTVFPDSDQITNPGRVRISVPALAYTKFPEVGEEPTEIGVWDFQVTFPGGDTVTFLAGNVYLKGDVSR